tara:strand:+ start:3707 stop:4177 length:471 start_codon:yes stop_codon:yes gene_type:complete
MADLVVTLTESVLINGTQRGSNNTLTITDIEHTFERVVTIPANSDGTVLLTKDTIASSDGATDIQDTKYIRVTNLDSTNNVNLSLQIDVNNNDSVADASASISLPAGHSFIMGTPHDAINVNSENASIVTAMKDLESIIVDSADQNVKVELFVAGI